MNHPIWWRQYWKRFALASKKVRKLNFLLWHFLCPVKKSVLVEIRKRGIEAVITPRRVLSFRPSHILKDRVDGAKMSTKADDALKTISEVSALLDVRPHVLRFWEGKF